MYLLNYLHDVCLYFSMDAKDVNITHPLLLQQKRIWYDKRIFHMITVVFSL